MDTEQPNLLGPTTAARASVASARSTSGFAALGRLGLLVLGFALPALLLYALALPEFATTIPGGPAAQKDGWQNVWNLWWTAFALRRGQNPMFTTWLYYPDGIGLFWQTLNLTNGLLALPITLAAGPVAAYNSLALAAFVLSGLAMYLLARELGASRVAAFGAGLLFSFAPLHVARLIDGQLEHLTIQWLPLYVLLLVRALHRGSLLAAVGAGLLLLWITLTSLYQALTCLIFLLLYAATLLLLAPGSTTPKHHDNAGSTRLAAVRAFPSGRQRLSRLVTRSSLILAVWLLPLLPALLGSLGGTADDDWLDKQLLHSATPLDVLLPNPNHPLWGEAVSRFGQSLHPDAGSWNIALGTTLLLLALAGLVLSRQARREPWPWVALACLLLALGPTLRLGSASTGIPLPYALINLLPAASLGQRPNYLALPALLALAVVAARGLDALLARSRRPRLLLVGIGLLLLVDLLPAPLGLTDSSVPQPLQALAENTEAGAVLELPFLPERSEPLQAQIAHQRPIMGGFVARTPYYPFPLERPALAALWTGKAPQELITPPWHMAASSTLRHYGIRYIVVRWRELEPKARASLSTQLSAMPQGTLQQLYDFQGLSVYRVSDDKPLLPFAFQRGAYPPEQQGGRAWQWIGETADLVLVNPTSEPRSVRLNWQAEAFRSPRELAIALVRSGSQSQPLVTLNIATTPTAGRLELVLPPGETRLALRTSAELASQHDPRRLGIAFTRIELR